jgi:DNA-binding response OmpR family regulator
MTKRALIIDDDHANQTLWNNFLVENGYEVLIAPDISTAQQYVSEDISLYVVDYYLPDGYGTDMVAVARENAPGSLVMMVSMDDDTDVVKEAMRLGGNVYMVKPSTPTLMTEILNEIETGALNADTHQLINRYGRRSYSA